MMQPPFTLSPQIVNRIAEISRLLGLYEGLHEPVPQPKLRKENHIKTIQSTLEIEGNTLDQEQVTAVLENKRVIGPKKDILEVQNAVELYQNWEGFHPADQQDFLRAHGILMKGLTASAGKYRRGAVGIIKGSQVGHIA